MKTTRTQPNGHQRLSLTKLQEWEALGYGMFIHFGMSTFDGKEMSDGEKPSTHYRPDRLDVDQWVRIARDAGMKYAVLTAKHVSGHCLWPTKLNDYHVGTSLNKTDVVGAFVTACREHGLMPGLYYCSWDNHNRFGSKTPSYTKWHLCYTTAEYQQFQTAQLQELLTQYGTIGEVWIDIPGVLPRDYRNKLYTQIAQWQPDTLVLMNHGITDGAKLKVEEVWPTDLISIERFLPPSASHHVKWREVDGNSYYLPGEVCDTVGKEWFYKPEDRPRSDEELLGMYLVTRARGANLLLDVGPDKNGLIAKPFRDALMRLRRNLDKLEL